MNNMIDYYEILEVSPNAGLEVIRAAYNALLHHYNLEHDSEDQTEVQKLDSLNLAYEVLSDPDRREIYDHELNKVRNALSESLADKPDELVGENVNYFSQTHSDQSKEKISSASGKSSVLSRLKWNKWGWSVSILVVVAVLISMVQPDPDKALRGQAAVKSHLERKEVGAELKKTDVENQQTDPAENKRKSEDSVN
jgi:curved DNA-binding protein CbpA